MKKMWIGNVAEKNKSIKQEFYAKGKFNNILLEAKKTSKAKTHYLIELYAGKKKIKKFNIDKSDINQNIICLFTGDIYSNKKQKYTIKITPLKQTKDSIKWAKKYTRTGNIYDGNLYINGKKTSSDLNIDVYYSYESPYMSKINYLLITLFVLLLEIYIFKYFLGEKKK